MADKVIHTFVIKVGDTFYMTDGTLLTYNMEEAKKAKKDKEKKIKGVEDIEKTYWKEHGKEHTYYEAVSFDGTGFSGINTGKVP